MTEKFSIWIPLVIGIGGTLLWLALRDWLGLRAKYRETEQKLQQARQEAALAEEKISVQREKTLSAENALAAATERQQALDEAIRDLQMDLSRAKAQLESYAQRQLEITEELNYKNQQISRLQEATLDLRTDKAHLEAQNRSLSEQQAEQLRQITALHQKAHLEFEKMATEILKDRTESFTQANKTHLAAILQPLSENIEGFKKIVRETHLAETKDRTTLETKISELIKQTNQVSEQANNLATALKGQVKKQGNWGEMILESILEQSGLVKDRQFFLQSTLKDAEGRMLRPDVLIQLPGSRTIIIDSKVSLVAYDRYVAADTKQEQQVALKEHLQSIYQHIDQLHSKNYDQIDEALDFTMLFIPIEPAYLLGIHEDPALWSYAYNKRILLISPTNLIACLKLMDDLWKRELQSRNAMEIVKQGESIYEKLVGFSRSLETVGDHLGKAQMAYGKAIGQMATGRGNLIDQAVKLKSMGLKSSKTFSKSLMTTGLESSQQAPENDEKLPAD